MAAGDYLLILISFLAANYYRFKSFKQFIAADLFALGLLFLLAWSVCAYSQKLYSKFLAQDRTNQWVLWLRVFVVHLLLVIAFNGLIKTYFSRLVILYTYFGMFVLHTLWRIVYPSIIKAYYKKEAHRRTAILVGAYFDDDFVHYIERNTPTGVEVLGYFGEEFPCQHAHLGGKEKVLDFLEQEDQRVDEIYCSLPRMEPEEVQRIMEYADNNLIQVMFIPDQKGVPYSKLNLEFFGHVPVFTLRHLRLYELPSRVLKRIFDFFFSTLVILGVLSWLTPIIALLIKLDSRGPVFFLQKRSGIKNKNFTCVKFRTMRINQDAHKAQAKKGDARITPLGSWLRKTSIDELPQFFNVWLGQMSVVGPRPHMVSHTETYSKKINKFMVRHLVKPGITGLSQVIGLRGETSNPHEMRHRVKVDIFYLEHWSFLFDLKIIGLTIWNIFKGDDKAY